MSHPARSTLPKPACRAIYEWSWESGLKTLNSSGPLTPDPWSPWNSAIQLCSAPFNFFYATSKVVCCLASDFPCDPLSQFHFFFYFFFPSAHFALIVNRVLHARVGWNSRVAPAKCPKRSLLWCRSCGNRKFIHCDVRSFVHSWKCAWFARLASFWLLVSGLPRLRYDRG